MERQSSDAPTDDTRNQFKDEDVSECPPQCGYKLSICRCLIFYPLAILPACIGLLLAYWFPHAWVRLTCSSCSLSSAHWVVVKDINGKWRVEKVKKFSLPEEYEDSEISEVADLLERNNQTVKFFTHQHLRYLFDDNKGQYVLLRGYEKGQSCNDLHDMKCGLQSHDHHRRLTRHGPNKIDVPVKPYYVLFVEEVLHPFYIFQLLSVIIWIADVYYLYAGAVFVISTISVLTSLIQTRRHMKQLHDMVITTTQVSVIRNRKIVHDVSSETLVPGDVLVIPRDGMMMPCDSVLLTGNVIVNEAMLTGESVPITKTLVPMEQVEYSPHKHKRHTLFAGTQIIQARYYSQGMVLAVVVRTSFLTSKGGMVRSILFPKPLNIKFYWDSIKFILILAVLAVLSFIYTILVLQLRSPPYDLGETILRSFDIITTVVPPSLPAAITVGTVYALNRLRKHQIYCISPQRVNLCGKIKLVCFDKTGTLTEDSLDVLGVQPATTKGFSHMVHDPSELPHNPLLFAMATCHSLTRINGVLSGDPLDLKMFLSTGWELEEPGEDDTRYDTIQLPLVHPPKKEQEDVIDNEYYKRCHSPWEPAKERKEEEEEGVQLGILKQFTFSSELQCMSVLVRKLPSEDSRLMHVFVKGAPEKIKQLSHTDSIPDDFYEVLASLTQKGYRVLAIGYKQIRMAWHHAERLERDAVECDLTFCGLLVLENKLKPQTFSTIQELQMASIRTVMITGDNLLTAVAVSVTSGMVASHHRVIVIKSSNQSSNSRPSLSYHVLGNEGFNQSLLYSNTASIAVGEVHDKILNVNRPSINRAINRNGLSYQALDIEHREYFHLAVDGHTFAVVKEHYPEVFEKLLVCGSIFARMSPIQKSELVTELMGIGYGVAMCGDGANDCGALKAAHAGISLSETEASVASPFTSKTPNITCVPLLIKEGRDALVTSFSVFKFMALYSLIEFSSVAILYAIESNFGSQEYLYVDFVLILAIAFVMGLTGPYPHLVKRRPIGTLAGIHVIVSVITQAVLMLAMQLGIFFYVQTQHWFKPLKSKVESENIVCWENTALFTLSIYQYIALAIAFSTAAPYRKPLYTNYWFMLTLAILIPANLYITLAPQNWVPEFWSFMQVKPSPSLMFRITIVELAVVHFLIAYLLEGYILPSSCMHKFLRIVRCKRKPHNRYKHILKQVSEDTTWPPVLPFSSPAIIN